METPRVNPVGVLEVPEEYESEARRFSPGKRLAVGLLLLLFTAATVGTSIVSVGAYCLTSGGDTRVLRDSVERLAG